MIKLGHKKRVKQTLDWALDKFQKHGEITVAINRKGKPFNFPNKYAPDSVSYIFHVLALLNDKQLIKKYKPFLESEIKKYYEKVINSKTGLVKNKHFSSMKDYSIRNSSCYDNIFTALLSKNLDKLKLKNHFKKFNYQKLLIKNFWNGKYFNDDLITHCLSTDANIYQFYYNLVPKKYKSSTLKEIHKRNLNKPLSLMYSHKSAKFNFLPYHKIIGDWETNKAWAHIAPYYISILPKKQAKLELNKYITSINKYKTLFEVFNKDKPHKTLFWHSDHGMIWIANFLYLKNKLYK